jgi:hypothetical protein
MPDEEDSEDICPVCGEFESQCTCDEDDVSETPDMPADVTDQCDEEEQD